MIREQNPFSLMNSVYISNVYITQNRKQTCLHHNTLTFWPLYEMGKSPREPLTWIVEKRIYSANQRIFTIIDVILIRQPTARRCGGMNLTDPHDANILIESEIGRIVLIV